MMPDYLIDDRQTTRQKVFGAHGSEPHFYLDWALGRVSRRVQGWFRRAARADEDLRRDVASVDRPGAAEDIRTALEVTKYLAPSAPAAPPAPLPPPAEIPAPDGDSLTTLALAARKNERPAAADAPAPDTPPSPAGPTGGEVTDGELMGRLQQSRDPEALAALCRRHGNFLRLRARQWCPRPGWEEDLVQQVWVGLLEPSRALRPRYDPRRWSVRAYLCHILGRAAADQARRCRRSAGALRFADLGGGDFARTLVDRDGGPAEQAATRDFLEWVSHSLGGGGADMPRTDEGCPAPPATSCPRLLERALGRLSGREQVALCAWYESGGDGDRALLLFRSSARGGEPLAYRDYLDVLRRSRKKLRHALGRAPLCCAGARARPVPCSLPSAEGPRADVPLRRHLRQGLFPLLEEIEVVLPPPDEVREAGLLLGYLAGDDALDRFGRLHDWLQDARARVEGPRPAALDRVLLWLAGDLFLRDGRGYRFHLSFRLFLRARLEDYCRRRGWQPAGPRYRTLTAACAALSRERLGDVVRRAVREDDGVAEAGVAAGRVLEWLEAAP